jgi:murein DD-endopeptidase MepM/ murein hydrolase activator NlpD
MVSVIAVLLIVAAAMVVWTNDRQLVAENENQRNINNNRNQENFLIGEGGIDVIRPVPTVDSRDTPAPPSKSEEKSSKKVVNPIAGGVVSKGYSGDSPIYSSTLDQYVVHRGIDIEAPPETPVKAAKGGTITKIYNDDQMGITIEINHGDGYVTRYGSLSTDRMVEEGDVVETGDVISGVGITALFESSDPPHLHFEVLKDGVPIDPAKFIKIE